MGIFVYVKKRMTMVIENKDAIRLVELLKASKKLDQKKTSISFNMDGSRCSLHLSWKSKKKKDMYNADADTTAMLCIMLAWNMGGVI